MSRLKKSENRRIEIEKKLIHPCNQKSIKEDLEKIMNMKHARAVKVHDDEQAGLLFNLSENSEILGSLDTILAETNHASRDSKEHPVAIVSENELEMVSYPIREQVAVCLRKINEVMMDNSNMVGHIVVSQKRVEVTPGFAGVDGNLLWVNTGGSALLLNIETDEDTRSILLKPGYGFCLGKRDRYARVFLSSLDCVDDLFAQSECVSRQPHAMFFGSEKGDRESWRGAMNVEVPAKEYGKKIVRKELKGLR